MLQSNPPCAACSGVQLVSAECGPGMQTAALQRCTDMVTAGAAPCVCTMAPHTDLITVIVAHPSHPWQYLLNEFSRNKMKCFTFLMQELFFLIGFWNY